MSAPATPEIISSGPTLGEFLQQQGAQVPMMGHGRAYLCSIMPIGYEQTENHIWLSNSKAKTPSEMFSWRKTYAIPPAGGDYADPQPIVYELQDVYQQSLDQARTQAEEDGLKYGMREIRAVTMRDSLVDQWRSSIGVARSGGRPGIFPIASSRPTERELSEAVRLQVIWTDFLVARADQLWAEGKRGEVRNLHRRMAKWRGITRADDHPWIIDWGDTKATKRCLACDEVIPAAALKCKHCGSTLALFAREINFDSADLEKRDPVVAAHVARLAEVERKKEQATKSAPAAKAESTAAKSAETKSQA